MSKYVQSAPAKLNLALDILGRRPDGYHEMRMVMQTVDLCDRVTLEETGSGFILSARGIDLPSGKKSLEQQAAESFFVAAGQPLPPLRVTLDKQTPAYAGLGGGSADAAAVLRLLRQIYAPDLSAERLESIGLTVGSDMPFCIRGGTALAEGRGEVLTDLPPLPTCKFVICKPDFDLPTPEMFSRLRFDASLPHPDTSGMAEALRRGDLIAASRSVGNIFEEFLTAEERQEINTIKGILLRHGALASAMSGSGPAVFGLFAPEEDIADALAALRRRYTQVFSASPVPRLI